MSYLYRSDDRRSFTVTGEPKGKGRPKAMVRGGHAAVYTPAETAVYENHVAQCYLSANDGKPPYEGAVGMEVHAYFRYPKSAHWPVNGKHNGELRDEWAGRSHTSKPDADNVLKAVLDGLSKANAWTDDSQVAFIVMVKSYSDEPRVEVSMWGISEVEDA